MKKIKYLYFISTFVLLSGMQGHLFSQAVIWLDSDFNAPRLVKTDTTGTELESFSLEAGSQPQGLAADGSGDRLYWTSLAFVNAEVNQYTHYSVFVVELQSALRGIAIDTLNQQMYWISTNLVTGPKIWCGSLDGIALDVLIDFPQNGIKGTPRDISLDVAAGKMYWTNFAEGKIQRADLVVDAEAEDIISGLNGPSGIAVDPDSGKVFWTEMNGGQIKSADLDGTNDSLLVTGLSYPNYLTVDRYLGRMAWTEMGSGKVKSAALDGSDIFDYEVEAVAPTGIIFDTYPVTGISGEESHQLPVKFALQQNYPNPFNPVTRIEYALPQNAQVTMELFDMLGRKIKTLVDKHKSGGYHTLTFDAGNLASGIYLYRIQAGSFISTKKMLLIK